ncbi:NUDIX hydrolase domain-like protein [Aspergillus ambiguus]|uniref:nucleotide triphosphate diphosphatase NUDT15 n=1 Tax=Aspergillus ambiguus TaxID=176160 RepID=UPI003CCDCADA
MNPRIGVGVFVFNRQGQFIIGQRKGSHGEGTWALPGGHLEFAESFEECAAREISEETSLEVRDIHYITATNDVMQVENKHYVTIFVGAHVTDEKQEARIMEPEKCDKWEWVTLDELRGFYEAYNSAEKEGTLNSFEGRRLFIPILNLFRQRGDQLGSGFGVQAVKPDQE